MKKKILVTLCGLSLGLLAGAPFAVAQTPTTFTYQGKLDYSHRPANGPHDMTFQVFASVDQNDPKSSRFETNAVPVSDGLFTVALDFGSAPFTGEPRWLEISVKPSGANTAPDLLSPRTALSPTPYAIYAQTAGSVSNGAIGSAQLARDAVTAPNIASGQVVKSLNGLKDDLTLVAGTGVTLLTNGNSLQISATSGDGTLNLPFSGSMASPNTLVSIANSGAGPAIAASSLNTDWRLGTIFAEVPAAAGRAESSALRGINHSGLGYGLYATHEQDGIGAFCVAYGGAGIGVQGANAYTKNYGQLGTAQYGVAGYNTAVYNGCGVYGEHTRTGNYGEVGHPLYGVRGSGTGDAVAGVGGVHESTGNWGAVGTANQGVYGQTSNPNNNGVSGENTATTGNGNGVVGRSSCPSGSGVYGEHLGNGGGVAGRAYGANGVGVYGHSVNPSGHAGVFDGRVQVNGDMQVCTLTIVGGCDLAEPFQMSEDKIPEGSVVVIDEENPGHLKQATRAYDTRVAGIVSGANGVKAGIALHQEGVLEGGQNVALSGRVHVKADASFGAIKSGDLLTTSDMAGHAMKVTDQAKAQGAIIGKAMTALDSGTGTVLVLVSLQ